MKKAIEWHQGREPPPFPSHSIELVGPKWHQLTLGGDVLGKLVDGVRSTARGWAGWRHDRWGVEPSAMSAG
jgi:hypothetical protein